MKNKGRRKKQTATIDRKLAHVTKGTRKIEEQVISEIHLVERVDVS